MIRRTHVNKLALFIITFTFALPLAASDGPVQHLKIADVTSMQDAKKIFIDKTAEIKARKKLDPAELQQIHFITYSLEKSVAYFVENLEGSRQELAKEIAIVVEEIHLSSENNRREETEKHLNEYFGLAEKFMSGF